jgi:hypothetical protein
MFTLRTILATLLTSMPFVSQWVGDDDKDDGPLGLDGKDGAGGFAGKGMDEDAELDEALRKNGMGGRPEEVDLSADTGPTSAAPADMGDA